METLTNVIKQIDAWVWGIPLILLILLCGIWLTIRVRGLQVRRIGLALKFMVKNEEEGEGEVTSFGALCTALSATIGTGNIVGVATAIAAGGPGALFWMEIAALFGMATKYAEGFLGNLLGRTAEQRAVRVRKNHGQVQLLPLYAVVRRNFSGSLYLFLMLLSVRYRQRQHLVCAVLIHSKPQTGCAVYAAAEKNQCFHMIYPPRVIPAKRDPSGMRRRRFSLWFEMRRCGCHELSCSCASR